MVKNTIGLLSHSLDGITLIYLSDLGFSHIAFIVVLTYMLICFHPTFNGFVYPKYINDCGGGDVKKLLSGNGVSYLFVAFTCIA